MKLALAIVLLLPCGCGSSSGGGGGGTPPPLGLSYAHNPGLYRAGEAIVPNPPAVGGGEPDTWSVFPPLPQGLDLAGDGVISGTPLFETPSEVYTVTASNAGGSTDTDLTIAVGPQLPAAFASLAPGFVAQEIATGVTKVAKLAPAPDGRIFFTEVDSGEVRLLLADGTLQVDAFATVTVLTGGHQGLLGLALDPDFESNGHVFVLACLPATMTQPDRLALLRFTDSSGVGTNLTTIWDNLPISPPAGINNGGEILFRPDGTLFLSLGDVQDPANSQAPPGTSLAGKVLRIVPTDPPSVPADNPQLGSPEWCRGLRNTFGLAIHPTTGDLFGADNGPASNDELNFLQPGKNFEWGALSPIPPAEVGFQIRVWPDVITPTGICWHDGTGWGASFADDLFLASYTEHRVYRLEMSGVAFTDIDLESQLAELVVAADDNRPLAICRDPATGDLLLATFTAIYRLAKQ